MKKLMNKVMLSCNKATYLIEIEKYKEISTLEKIQLKMHLKMCAACNRYNIQSKFVDVLIQKISNSPKIDAMVSENTVRELENKIIDSIE